MSDAEDPHAKKEKKDKKDKKHKGGGKKAADKPKVRRRKRHRPLLCFALLCHGC